MEAREIISKGLRVWDTKGWCRGAIDDGAGYHCAMGAINLATWNNAEYVDFYRADYRDAVKLLADHIVPDSAYRNRLRGYVGCGDEEVHQVVAYNNSRESFDEIREWFEKTIAAAVPADG